MLLDASATHKFYTGECLGIMQSFDSDSVDCVITSPPYWGQRRYDGDDDKKEIGREASFKEYVQKLVAVFGEVHRVLKNSGSLWLNMGDKYEDKAMLGMPWRVAIALMDKGWIMRNDVIWNQMKGTQSCKDRLRDSYEHLFHFVKNKKYFYDADAIRIKPAKMPVVSDSATVSSTGVSGVKYRKLIAESTVLTAAEKAKANAALEQVLQEIRSGSVNDFRMTIRGAQRAWHSEDTTVSGRAKELEKTGYYIIRMRSKGHIPSDIWNIVPEDTWRRDNHCAVFPEELLRIPILATCPLGGIVLDPFSGTGTTVSAAVKLGRRGIGIDLSMEYTATAENRLAGRLL